MARTTSLVQLLMIVALTLQLSSTTYGEPTKDVSVVEPGSISSIVGESENPVKNEWTLNNERKKKKKKKNPNQPQCKDSGSKKKKYKIFAKKKKKKSYTCKQIKKKKLCDNKLVSNNIESVKTKCQKTCKACNLRPPTSEPTPKPTFEYIQYGCTPSGPVGIVDESIKLFDFTFDKQFNDFDPENCARYCGDRGHKFFGLACPTLSSIFCLCNWDESKFPSKVPEEKTCRAVDGDSRHCVGPKSLQGVDLGDYFIGSIYKIPPELTLENVALGKPTSQSSTHVNNNIRFESSNAVNGDRTVLSITDINDGLLPFWKVDLQQQHVITKVEVWNRLDCCQSRLNGFVLHIYSGSSPVWSSNSSTIEKIGNDYIVNVPSKIGDAVMITLPSVEYLQLGEVVVLGSIAPPSSTPTPPPAQPVIDLSQDFPPGEVNRGEIRLRSILEGNRNIARMLVLEKGEIKVDYQRAGLKDGDIFNLWSLTKPIMSMIFGKIIQDKRYNLDLRMTLEDIFPDDSEWRKGLGFFDRYAPHEWDHKRSATVRELLTFTSGLSLDANVLNLVDIPNSVGATQGWSLKKPWAHVFDKNKWRYWIATNVHSYIVKKVTGLTPREFLARYMLPHLGIKNSDIKWDTNLDGVETSMSSLRLTAKQYAKFLQLHLQKGEAAPGKQLLSADWVAEATSRQVATGKGSATTDAAAFAEMFSAETYHETIVAMAETYNETISAEFFEEMSSAEMLSAERFFPLVPDVSFSWYGYLWGRNSNGETHAAYHTGFGGSIGGYSDDTERVIVIQNDCDNVVSCAVADQLTGKTKEELWNIAIDPKTSFD